MNYMSESTMNSTFVKDNAQLKDGIAPIDDADFIDVDAMNLSDPDNWLSEGNQACANTRLPTSINCHLEAQELYSLKGNRKSIDTRTYTRAKRRMSRPSFESILNNSTDSSKTDNPLAFKIREHQDEECTIPHMLRPSLKTYVNHTSGPESMENFLNVAQSKVGDSLMNMSEPSFSYDLMNESQPSLLYTSLSTTMTREDHTSITTDILTNSMMQSSMFDDVKDVSSPFFQDNLNSTIVKNKNSTTDDLEFGLDDVSLSDLPNDVTVTMNATFDCVEQTNPDVDKSSTSSENDVQNNTYSKTMIANNSSLPINEAESPRRTTFLVRNDTFNASPKLNKTFEGVKPVFNSTFQLEEEPENNLNKTFEANSSPNPNYTYNTITKSPARKVINSTFDCKSEMEVPKPKSLMSLRQELLKEARREPEFDANSQKENFERQMNVTFDHQKNNDIQRSPRHSKLGEKNCLDRKLTFTVKNNNTFTKDDAPDLNATFQKPVEKLPVRRIQRRLAAPGMYSKAPGLQKSNPNLISGSSENVSRLSLIKFPRGSQPNIAAKDVTYNMSEFSLAGATSGSTESIGSTQSAHSAPDFDDRLSNCSENSSRGSYTIRRMDSDQLHKIAQMQEQSLSTPYDSTPYESTPKPLKFEEKFHYEDLPSPIAKTEQDRVERGPIRKVPKPDFDTSSPTDHHHESAGKISAHLANQQFMNTTVTKVQSPTKQQSKLAPPMEVKSKLRQPTNFNRPVSAASGIPRPMSRIPGPKSTRPKTAQNNVKK